MHLVIFGRGKFARLIASELQNMITRGASFSYTLTGDLPLDGFDGKQDVIVVHVGSGKKLADLITECNSRRLPIIQASTGIDWSNMPTPINTPIVDCPNLELGIVALFDVLPAFGARLQKIGACCHLTESHQSDKKSVPGTAIKFAKSLGVSPEKIVSIRDRSQQLEIGVPEDHLSAHGHHIITVVTAGGAMIEIRTKVNGRKPYVSGLIQVADKIDRTNGGLEKGVLPVEKFMFA